MVFSDRLLVIHVTHSHREFCCMQSRLHETWSLMFGSTHGVGGAAFYSPITCFETFPFPEINGYVMRFRSERAKVSQVPDRDDDRSQ